MSEPFVDFGKKSVYSLKKALGNINSILPILKERNQKYYVVSDYGEVGIWPSLYFTCKENAITPILGVQTFVNNYRFFNKEDGITYIKKLSEIEEWEKCVSEVSDDEKDWSQIDFPINIFAASIEGYYNIIKIHNDAQINGIGERPRTSDAFLKTHTNGVIATIPTPYSEISSLVYNGLKSEALAKYECYKKTFDDVYVEIPILEDEDYREINKITIAFCKENNIKMIPVINSHYDTIDDKDTFPVFQQCGKLRGGFTYEVDYAPNMYYKTTEEVWDTFKKFHESDVFTEEAMQWMFVELNNLLHKFKTLDIDTSPKMPKVKNSDKLLRELAFAGLKEKKLHDKKEYVERIEYELDNIIKAGFADYFIMLQQLFEWYKNEKGCLQQTGRGSSAGCLVLYCIGVTKIDPIKYHLLFERFLDASRLDEIINKGGKISGADFPDVDCFELDTLILTEKGLIEIGKLNIGDMVVTRDGSLHAIEKMVDFKNTPTVRVCYGDWYFDCTINHRVLVKRNNNIDYMYVNDLMQGDFLVEDEENFIPIVDICNYKLSKCVRDLKIEGKHCFRVCGRAFNKVVLKDGSVFYLSDKELNN